MRETDNPDPGEHFEPLNEEEVALANTMMGKIIEKGLVDGMDLLEGEGLMPIPTIEPALADLAGLVDSICGVNEFRVSSRSEYDFFIASKSRAMMYYRVRAVNEENVDPGQSFNQLSFMIHSSDPDDQATGFIFAGRIDGQVGPIANWSLRM